MAFISLRKTQPTDPASTEGEDLETTQPDAADDSQEQPAAKAETEAAGFPRAIVHGVRGWLTWCSNLIGPGWTWALHTVALWAAAHYDLRVTLGVSTGLVLAVAAFIPRKSSHRLAQRIERLTNTAPPGTKKKTAAAAATDAPVPAPTDPLITLLWQLIGDAPGTHLKTLCEALAAGAHKRGAEAPTRAEVKASLEARGIPLRNSVRDAQERVNKGVHRDDLTAALHTPSPAPAPDA